MIVALVLAFLGGAPLPGWIGFATTRPGASAKFGWSPVHREAGAVVFSWPFRSDWAGVAPGTVYRGITAHGTVGLRYLGTSDEPYGCDQNTQTMTAFGAGRRLPEGPVWVLPPDATVKPVPVPVVAARPGKNARAWTVGAMAIALRKTGELTALLRVTERGHTVFEETVEKHFMAGADRSPVDLSGEREIGMPFPRAAFVLSAGGPRLVVFQQPGYEGHSFRSLFVENGQASFLEGERHSPHLYYCAF